VGAGGRAAAAVPPEAGRAAGRAAAHPAPHQVATPQPAASWTSPCGCRAPTVLAHLCLASPPFIVAGQHCRAICVFRVPVVYMHTTMVPCSQDFLPALREFMRVALGVMRRHEDAWPFRDPVSRAEVPDYYDIIRVRRLPGRLTHSCWSLSKSYHVVIAQQAGEPQMCAHNVFCVALQQHLPQVPLASGRCAPVHGRDDT
jgi:hypothetical protein